jgi:predicted AAA+ superfamily ATPase
MTADNSDVRGQIWLTGSQTLNMMQEIAKNLPGRAVIIDMFGFSIYERCGKGLLQKPFLPSENIISTLEHKSPEETFRIIWQGSFPDVTEKNYKERTAFYSSYVKTYVESIRYKINNINNENTFNESCKDIQMINNDDDNNYKFVKFLKILAAGTGQELNLRNILPEIGINLKRAWLSLLENSGLVFLLQLYSKSDREKASKTPKLYFMDTGLAAYLAGKTTPESLRTGRSAGAFFETFVISEIVKSYYHNGFIPNNFLYYYRDKDKNEIDLLIEKDGEFYPIEIKTTTAPIEEDIKAFEIFSKAEKTSYGVLICLTDEKKFLDKNKTVTAISIWDI